MRSDVVRMLFGIIFLLIHMSNGCNCNLQDNFYSLSAMDVDGNNVSFETYRKKAILVMNTNTNSNYSEQNLSMLMRVQDVLDAIYQKQYFTALVFPNGEFTPIEKDQPKKIQDYMRKYYNPDYRIFNVVDIFGENAHPVYKNIIGQCDVPPTSDFWKYIVNHEGKVVRIFEPHLDLREVVYGCKDATKAAFDEDRRMTKIADL